MKVTFLTGDATQPQGEGNKVIVHVCNDLGAWGAGFVLALSKRWSAPEKYYRAMHKDERYLGNVQFVHAQQGIAVANMIGQHGIGYDENGVAPIRYDAVRTALTRVNAFAVEENASIHMPRIGCGLAGGKWEEIAKIIKDVVTVDVYVYDFK